MSAPFRLTEPVEPDLARAVHARRALEQALDHGTALLAALGLPPLPSMTRAMALLDAIDAPDEDLEEIGDDEPWLAWVTSPSTGCVDTGSCSGDRELDLSDGEPSLGAPEQHESGAKLINGRWIRTPADQRRWADGGLEDHEGDVVDEPHDEDVDAEEDLGWSANVSQLVLGPNTADGDATALESHGKGFRRSRHEDDEDDDPGGTDESGVGDLEGLHEQYGFAVVGALPWSVGGYVA